MRTDDGYIIHQCLNGDPDAFGLLVDKYKAGIYALAYSKLRNFHDAQDVAQEVFIRAYESLHKLRRWESFAAWLYRITYRQCRNWIRAQSKRPDNESLEDSDAGILDSHSMESYRSELVNESVHDALDSLPEVHRQLLTLRYLGGMNSSEIARFVGVSPAAVRRRLVNARAALKAEMLDTMSGVFEEQRLQAIFTLRILEMVKHIRVQPLTRLADLGLGLSVALGIMIAVLGSGSFIKLQNYMDASASEVAGSTGAGEIPVTFTKQTGEWERDAGVLNSKKISVATVSTPMLGILSGNAMAQTEWTRYEVNPVLAKGADGTWDDEGFFKPSVLFLPDSEPDLSRGHKMYYGAYDGSDWHVGLATSGNGIDWVRYTDGGNPIPLLIGEGSGWDRKSIDCCEVFLDDGLYKAWYSGTDGFTHKIGYATSTDGIEWQKYDRDGDGNSIPSERIVLDKGDAAWESKSVYWPAVLIVENVIPYPERKYKMWYSATDGSNRRIGFATSEDGIHWQKYDKDDDGNPDPVLEPTAGWESLHVFAPSVLYDGTIYRMWYAGHDGSHAKIGYATSEDGIHWQKYDKDGDGNPDPVLDLGESGEWDNFHVSTPSVMFDGVGYKMWYVGSNGSVLGIGYASAPID